MAETVRITLHPLGRTFEAPAGASLQDLLFACGVEFPCGGLGRCKGCSVRLLAGNALATPEDRRVFTTAEIDAGWRLACHLRPREDIALEIAQWETAVLGDETRFAFRPREGLGIAVDLGTTTVVAQGGGPGDRARGGGADGSQSAGRVRKRRHEPRGARCVGARRRPADGEHPRPHWRDGDRNRVWRGAGGCGRGGQYGDAPPVLRPGRGAPLARPVSNRNGAGGDVPRSGVRMASGGRPPAFPTLSRRLCRKRHSGRHRGGGTA